MKTAEQNYRLLQEIEANRRFLLAAYEQNPKLLENAELRIQQMFATTEHVEQEEKRGISAAKQRGTSLIELIMFIVIVSVALAGILLVMNVTTRGSADPVIHKQALAIAESLLEEIELQDFYNPLVGGFSGAATQANRASFDDIMDYHGFQTTGIYSPSDTTSTSPVSGVTGYSVAASAVWTTSVWNGIPAGSAVVITVTVQAPSGETLQSVGYRTAY